MDYGMCVCIRIGTGPDPLRKVDVGTKAKVSW